ncbi:hypothetical protein, partial [Paenibacillus hubeiensis]|uniref:hypothetical protein n=1 Tax=Paenibacillus hubeiensis TaxID=3077330 RepID=UPI0031B9EA05
MHWRSAAVAFDTRWLPCPTHSGHRGATAIGSAAAPGATTLAPTLICFFRDRAPSPHSTVPLCFF